MSSNSTSSSSISTKAKLTSKDLINIGIFSAIYMLVCVAISGIVITPILQLLMTPLIALLTGPIYFLYIAKTQKPFCILITGLLFSVLVGLLVYGNVICFVLNFTCFVAAEIAAYIGKYKNFKLNMLSYTFASFSALVEAALFWYMPDFIYNLALETGYSQSWVDGVVALTTPTNLALVIAGVIVCAIISSLASRSILKKHFKKAGII